MAFTVTERGFDTQNSSAADLTFGPFTPAANSVLVAVIAGGLALTVNGVSGHTGGASWVQIVSIPDFSGTNRDFQVWACFTGASPSSASVAIDIDYADSSMAALYEIEGADVSGTVANAFGVSGSEYGYDLSPWTAALGAFASATNLTFAVGVQADSSPTFTWEGGYTVGTAQTGFLRLQAAWIAAEDNSVVLTTESLKHALLWATEIKEAAAAGGEVAGTPMQSLSAGFGPARAARINGVLQ